ncbi:MAG: resolvase, partial [Oscillospiraceae bacterium]|nr:resolvase [Oscillospiraceae bacterium]
DKVAGVISESQFVELNQSFLDEKSRLERRLATIEEELTQREDTQHQTGLLERAQELLKLETVPRELVVGLIEKIEIGEKRPETGQQNVSITWKF